MQRIVAELYDVILEGNVFNDTPIDELRAEFDLESELTLRCDDEHLYEVSGWVVDIALLRFRD